MSSSSREVTASSRQEAPWRPIDINGTSESIARLGRGVEGIMRATATRQGVMQLTASEAQMVDLSRTLAAFVAVDVKFEQGARAIGTVCANILKQDDVIQRRVIRKLCEVQEIEVTNRVGRAGLIHALFGRYPELMKRSGNDSLAGKRLSWYLRVARNAEGMNQKDHHNNISDSAHGSDNEMVARIPKMGMLFLRLYRACSSSKEEQFLLRIAGRAGVEYEDWLDAIGCSSR